MLHLRILAGADAARRVVSLLEREPGVAHLAHLPGAAVAPAGDLVLCDVAREDASLVLDRLRGEEVSVTVIPTEVVLSRAGDAAVEAAEGSPADAVVWEQVEARTSESTELSTGFLVFMAIASLLAGAAILTDSAILLIGAMVVGPEFGPLAGVCVALVQRRSVLTRRSFAALAVGFPVAVVAALLGGLAVRAAGIAPRSLEVHRTATLFISHPNAWSAIVAVLAGIAGVMSLTSAKSGALIGVLISVTTIPATANVGLAAAYGDVHELWGSALQLLVNVAALLVAGVATLALQRAGFARRRRARK